MMGGGGGNSDSSEEGEEGEGEEEAKDVSSDRLLAELKRLEVYIIYMYVQCTMYTVLVCPLPPLHSLSLSVSLSLSLSISLSLSLSEGATGSTDV